MPTVRFDPHKLSGSETQSPLHPDLRPSRPERRNHASREQLLDRVRTEFKELRALQLTLAQAQRLFGLREDICRRVLSTLVREDLLHLGSGDVYERKDHVKA